MLSILEAYECQKSAFVTSSSAEELYFGYTNNMAVTRKTLEALGPFLERQRGADTIFVREAIDKFSCDVVRHCPDICVRHLEITNAWHWYRKMVIYGASQKRYGQIKKARGLTNAERLQVCITSSLNFKSNTATLDPLANSVFAIKRPIPLPAPVIMAVFQLFFIAFNSSYLTGV